MISTRSPPNGRDYEDGAIAVNRFLSKIDLLAYLPQPGERYLCDAIVFAAQRAGRPLLLPAHLSTHYGDGPRYVEPEAFREVLDALAEHLGKGTILAAKAEKLDERGGSDNETLTQVKALIGPRLDVESTAQPTQKGPVGPPIALMVADDNIGAVDTLTAVARKLDGLADPVFVAIGAEPNVAASMGFTCQRLVGLPSIWDDEIKLTDWIAAELEYLVNSYAATLIIFAGDRVEKAIVQAIGPRGDAVLAKVRHAGSEPPAQGVAPFFDSVIEVDALFDDGARQLRTSAPFPATLLYDEEELLPREEAATALGLDQGQPSMLLWLGDRLTRGIVDRIVDLIRDVPTLQIVAADPSRIFQ